MSEPSPLKRREIIDALRAGTVPHRGLELFAVGLERFEAAIDEELEATATGRGKFKAVRGEYGTGKTFFARWLERRARAMGFASTLVQISETETPLYKMETVYRRCIEALQTQECSSGAFRSLVDGWFFSLEDDVLAEGEVDPNDEQAMAKAVGELLEKRLARVSATQPQFAAALRGCHTARLGGEHAVSEGLIAWLMGQPNVGVDIKRTAGLKGDLDHFGAGGFLRGLLEVLRQTGKKGLVLVLDEVETIQRVRRDSREKSLNALRQLIDDLTAGVYPGLYVLITGTPLFFEGPQGIRRLAPLEQRLRVDFSGDPRFDNPKAAQVRLHPFTFEKMMEIGKRVRALYPTQHAEMVATKASDRVLENLARGVAGKLGGQVGVAPRLFLMKLVDVLDRIDQHEDFDPGIHYDVVVKGHEMSTEEREAAGHERSVDDIELEFSD